MPPFPPKSAEFPSKSAPDREFPDTPVKGPSDLAPPAPRSIAFTMKAKITYWRESDGKYLGYKPSPFFGGSAPP